MESATAPQVQGNRPIMVGNLNEEIMQRLNLPKKHWYCVLSKIPDQCPHKELLVNWIDNLKSNVRNAKGMLLVGDYSRGKSGSAAIMLKAAASKGIIGLWLTARDLPTYVIEKTLFDDDLTVINRARQVPLLVIDELQIRDSVAYSEQAVEMLVRKRIDDGKCTIITTNHSTKELKHKYPALIAALSEAVYPVSVSGHNFRQEIADQWQKEMH